MATPTTKYTSNSIQGSAKIYRTQGYLQIRLNIGIDATAATEFKINYQKPDGTEGNWDATLSGVSTLIAQMENTSLDQIGTWKLQSYIKIDGLNGFGETVNMLISELFT